MTLVIAGHYLLRGIHENKSNDVNGLFAVSDSNITVSDSNITGSTDVILKNFQKVSEIPIKVKRPNFLGGHFNSYLDCSSQSSCFIAFAGSTLAAQHIISKITEHLANLCPTYEDGKYKIVMFCEKDRHIKQNDFYDTSMFQYHHLDKHKLLSAEYLSEVVYHSIEVVLGDMKSEKLGNNELILGVRCPRYEEFRLYQYETTKILRNDESVNVVNKSEITVGKVAVIGLKQKYACKAL
jgi:hypothetical protein